ncbi:MAG: zinc ribbon domain-containing protein [Chloroflexota bacterium]|nr:MAG: zinc ribbon domain-containing protein [Chloroflexota bacterium]
MPEFNLDSAGPIFTGLAIYGGLVVAAFWLAMIVWTYRDMRARSRDTFAQILAALLVAVLTVPGLIIYLLLRPRETLSEAYERSLEEEALLQEIEDKPTCPGCKNRVQADWQVCPSCHTRLKKPCIHCGQTLELPWNLCPYCATPQTGQTGHSTRRATTRAPSPQEAWAGYQSAASLEFIDGEE